MADTARIVTWKYSSCQPREDCRYMRDILFGHPAGLLGRLGGRIMVRQNQPLYTWTLSLLPVQTGDHVLEVGFGAGEAIHLLTKQTRAALIAGVDASPAMLSMAKKRNA